MPVVPVNLETLPGHAIFAAGKTKQDDWELIEGPSAGLVGPKISRMVLRDKDLIIAHGPEVRMCSLAEGGWAIQPEGTAGTYKVSSAEHPGVIS